MSSSSDLRECANGVQNAFKEWKVVIKTLLKCSKLDPIPTKLCEWLENAGNLVNESIRYTSLDSRMDNVTAAEFDRKYFPLIYGAQGNELVP